MFLQSRLQEPMQLLQKWFALHTSVYKRYGGDCANTIIIREDNRDSELDDD